MTFNKSNNSTVNSRAEMIHKFINKLIGNSTGKILNILEVIFDVTSWFHPHQCEKSTFPFPQFSLFTGRNRPYEGVTLSFIRTIKEVISCFGGFLCLSFIVLYSIFCECKKVSLPQQKHCSCTASNAWSGVEPLHPSLMCITMQQP